MLIAVSAILLVLGTLAYRKALFGQGASSKGKGQSGPRRVEAADVGLLVLRLVILLLFAAVFVGAVFTRVWTERPRRVAVVLDVSQSMGAVGAESAAAVVAGEFPMPAGATRQEWIFADSAEVRSQKSEARGQSADRTRIGAALKTVGKTRPGAVVLLSDGQDNGETDPVAAAHDIGVPVYTVGFGGVAKRNAAIEQVLLPAVVYSGETAEVRVRVITTGFDNGQSGMTGAPTARIRLSGQERAVPIGSGTAEQDVPFRLVFDKPGKEVIAARLDSLMGESNYADNTRSVTVDVRPGRVRVAYVTNRPGTSTRMILRALASDERIQVETLISVTGGVNGKWVQSPGALGARDSPHFPDVFVLDDVVESGSSQVWQAIADQVRAGAGALVLAGPDFQPGPNIGKVVGGVGGRGSGTGGETKGPYTPELTAEGKFLPWWGAVPAQGYSGSDVVNLNAVPPFTGMRPLARTPEPQNLRTTSSAVWLVAQENGTPLVLAGMAGKGKVVYVAGYPLWRWGFGPEEKPEQGTPLSIFLTGVVRYLAERDTSPFWLQTDRSDLYRGQPVRLTMKAVSPDGRPWSGLSVVVRVQQAMNDERGAMSADSAEQARPETVIAPMTETGAGVYEATIEALAPGPYHAVATVENADTTLGRATTDFAVADQPVELASTGMNQAALRAIAEASGGRFLSSDSLSSYAGDIALGSYQRRFSFDPRRAVWAYVLIALLAGAEWFLRRRRGLL